MDPTIVTQVGTAMQSMQGDLLGVVTTVAPYALVILGAFLAFKYGKKIFTSLAGK